jgi:cell division protein FtsI/penicillin-binding protein 2
MTMIIIMMIIIIIIMIMIIVIRTRIRIRKRIMIIINMMLIIILIVRVMIIEDDATAQSNNNFSATRKKHAHFPSIMRQRIQIATAAAASAESQGVCVDPALIARDAIRQSHLQHQLQRQLQLRQQQIDPEMLLDLLVTGRRIIAAASSPLPPPLEVPVPCPVIPLHKKSFGVLGFERRSGLVETGQRAVSAERGAGVYGVRAAAALEEVEVAVRLGLMRPMQQDLQQQHRSPAVVPLSFFSRNMAMRAAAAGEQQPTNRNHCCHTSSSLIWQCGTH